MTARSAIFTLGDLLEAVPEAEPLTAAALPGVGIGHLACHTKDVVAGASLFAAIRGGGAWYVDGGRGFDYHRYVPQAIAAGAAALLVEDAASLPAGSDLPAVRVADVIGALGRLTTHLLRRHAVGVTAVTGSTGKTSTCEMVERVLGRSHETFKFISNRATPVSVPRNILNAGVGTFDRLVMEMPMDALGQIRHLCSITPPQTGVVVNVNDSHIVQLGSIEAITDAKAELVEALPADGTAVLNLDDERVRAFGARTPAQVLGVTVGGDPAAAATGVRAERVLHASGIRLDRWGVDFVLELAGESAPAHLAVPSRRAVINAMLGAGAGVADGMPLGEVAAGLEEFRSLPGRMSPLHGRGGFAILDNSMLAVLQSTELMLAEALQIPVAGRRVLVQGEIYGAFQHGEPRERVYELMERFDAVYLSGPAARVHEEALRRRGRIAARWDEDPEVTAAAVLADVGPDDLVLVNGNEGSELVVGGLVDERDADRLVDDDVRAGM